MGKNRLEAFSDGVIAILITIMVLEMKVPHGAELADLAGIWPVFLSYVLSFIYLGIYWNNHHHLLHTARRVSGSIMWANLLLLFFLSLVPFTTGWMGENHFGKWPVIVYALNLLLAALSYNHLQNRIMAVHGDESPLRRALGRDAKGKISLGAYLVAMVAASLVPGLGVAITALVALMWLIPDQRIEKALAEEHH